MADGSIVIDTALDGKGIVNGIYTMNKNLSSGMAQATRTVKRGTDTISFSLQRVGRLFATVFGIGGLLALSKQALELSSSITEVDNVVEKAFGNMRGEMDALAKSAVQSLGMSRLTAYQTGSMFMSFGRTMVGDAEKAKDMALELTKLTGNLASFRNESHEVIRTRLKGIYTGETEAIEELGISLKVATLNQYALAKGMSKSYDKMTESEKIMLRYQYVMEQFGYVGNDFVDTQNTWANQTRILTENWKELLTVFGDGLVSVLTPVIQALNKILSQFIQIASYVGGVLGKFFNIEKQTMGSNNSTSDSFGNLTDSVGDYEDAITSAGKATKKALAPFDELNNITQSSASNIGSGSGAGINIPAFDLDNIITADDIKEQMELSIKSLEDLGLKASEALEKGLKKINWKSIENKAQELGNSFSKVLNGFFSNEGLASELGSSIAGMINTAIGFAYGFVSNFEFEQFGRWLGTLVNDGVQDTNWEQIGEYFGLKVNGIAESVEGFFETYETTNLSNGISTMLNKGIDTVDPKLVGTAIGDVIWNGFSLVEGIFNSTHLEDAVQKINTIISSIFTFSRDNQSLGVKVGSTLATIINKGIDMLVNANVEEAINSLAQFLFDLLYEGITNIDVKMLASALEELIIKIPANMANAFAREATIFLLRGILSDEEIADIRERMATAESTAEEFGRTMREALNLGDENKSKGQIYFENYNKALQELNNNSKEFTYDGLTKLQEKYNLTDDAMDRLISSTQILYNKHELANRGLEGYTNNWELYKNKIEGLEERHKTAIRNQEKLAEVFDKSESSIGKATKSTDKLGDSVKNYVDIGNDVARDNALGNSLDDIAEKTENVTVSFDSLSTLTEETFDNMKTSQQSWWDMVSEQFSQEQWQEFGNNITSNMTKVLDTFNVDWVESLTLWMDSNKNEFFNYDVWNSMISDNVLKAYYDTWEIFSNDWNNNITKWQDDYVEPYFAESTWNEYGNNMKNGIVGGLKAVVAEVGGILGKLTDVFNGQMANIANSVNNMIKSVNVLSAGMNVSPMQSVTWTNIPKVQIPALATGAVLPANNPFLAIVGDQRQGTNIETPLSTMIDAFNTALNNREDTDLLRAILQAIYEKETGITEDALFNSVQRSARRFTDTTGKLAF